LSKKIFGDPFLKIREMILKIDIFLKELFLNKSNRFLFLKEFKCSKG